MSATLATAVVSITQTANWEDTIVGVGFLRTGILGLEEAYTLQLAFPGMVVTKDAREDALVDVVLGEEFGSVADLSTITAGLEVPIPAECQPDAPTVSPTGAPTETAGTAPSTAPAEPPAEG